MIKKTRSIFTKWLLADNTRIDMLEDRIISSFKKLAEIEKKQKNQVVCEDATQEKMALILLYKNLMKSLYDFIKTNENAHTTSDVQKSQVPYTITGYDIIRAFDTRISEDAWNLQGMDTKDGLMFLIDEPTPPILLVTDTKEQRINKIKQFVKDLESFAEQYEGEYFLYVGNPIRQFANEIARIEEDDIYKYISLVKGHYLQAIKNYYEFLKLNGIEKPIQKRTEPEWVNFSDMRDVEASYTSNKILSENIERFGGKLGGYFNIDSFFEACQSESTSQFFIYNQSETIFLDKKEFLRDLFKIILNFNKFIDELEFSKSLTKEQFLSPENSMRGFIEELYKFIFSCYLTNISLEECREKYQQLLANNPEKELIRRYKEYLQKQVSLFDQNIFHRKPGKVMATPKAYEANAKKYFPIIAKLESMMPFSFKKSSQFNLEQIGKFIYDCVRANFISAISMYLDAQLKNTSNYYFTFKSPYKNNEFVAKLKMKLEVMKDVHDIRLYRDLIITLEKEFADENKGLSDSLKDALSFVKYCLNELSPPEPKAALRKENSNDNGPSSEIPKLI